MELTINNCNTINLTPKTNTKELEECSKFFISLNINKFISLKCENILDNQQRFFNKYVRESVEKKLGKDFLLMHEIQEINSEVMEEIKSILKKLI